MTHFRDAISIPLLAPSEELAMRILEEEEPVAGMIGYLMAGGMPQMVPLVSFPALVEFLEQVGPSVFSGAGNPLVYVDPRSLKTWVEDSFGDVELASAIGEIIKRTPEVEGFLPMMPPLAILLDQRLEQSKAVLGLLDEPQDDDVTDESGDDTEDDS